MPVECLSAMNLYRARQGAHEAGIKLIHSMRDLDLVLTPSLERRAFGLQRSLCL